MERFKKSKFMMIILALVLLLAACSDSSKNTTKDDNNKEPSNEGEKTEEVVKLVYATGKDNTGSVQAMIDAFNASQDKIQVEFREMPSDTGQQHDAYVTMFNAESSEIDLFNVDVIWPAELAQAGYVLSLDRFIQNDGFDLSQYNQGALSAARFNGKLWALPQYADAGMLFYRSDVAAEPPKTWDELITSANELKGQGDTQFGYLMQAKQYEGLVCNAVEFIAAYGGKIINENGEVAINSEDTIQGLKKLVEVATSGFVPENITTFTEQESHTAFIEGQSPFIRNWPYQYALANDESQSKIVGKVSVAPLPSGDAGSASALGGWMTAINKYTEHPQEAWEFLKFLNGPEGQKINAVKGGKAPTIPALFEDEEVIAANPYFGEEGFVNALNNAVSRPVAPNYQEISEILQIHISKAIAGTETVEDAVKAMETEMKDALQ
jgi:multiple sugar transport system substrate-binding protein